MNKKEKVIIFVDNSNLFHSFQELNFHCDYDKLKKVITNKRDLIEIILYTGIMYPVKQKDKAWLMKLKELGYTVNTRAIKVAPNGRKIEKRIDVLMAVDIISSAYEVSYDTVVLVSGDGDFVPVVKKLRNLNIKIEVWSFKNLLSEQLKDVVGVSNINYINKIYYKPPFRKDVYSHFALTQLLSIPQNT